MNQTALQTLQTAAIQGIPFVSAFDIAKRSDSTISWIEAQSEFMRIVKLLKEE
jgi:type II secretory pathway component PulF